MAGETSSGDTCRTVDGLELAIHDWTLADDPATVAIVHGFAEHGGRYEHVARSLRGHGLGTVAVDLRGHGRSPGARGHVDRFTDYQRDLDALLETATGRGDGAVFLLAHSMGALITLDRLVTRSDVGATGVILSSPFLGLARRVSPLSLVVVRLLDRLWPRAPLPAGLDGQMVCRDEDLRRGYDEDPLVLRRTTARWFMESQRAIARVHRELTEVRTPLLVLAAGDDHVADVEQTRRLAAHAHFEDRLDVLPGHLHEILNEPPERRRPLVERIAAVISRWDGVDSPTSVESR